MSSQGGRQRNNFFQHHAYNGQGQTLEQTVSKQLVETSDNSSLHALNFMNSNTQLDPKGTMHFVNNLALDQAINAADFLQSNLINIRETNGTGSQMSNAYVNGSMGELTSKSEMDKAHWHAQMLD